MQYKIKASLRDGAVGPPGVAGPPGAVLTKEQQEKLFGIVNDYKIKHGIKDGKFSTYFGPKEIMLSAIISISLIILLFSL